MKRSLSFGLVVVIGLVAGAVARGEDSPPPPAPEPVTAPEPAIAPAPEPAPVPAPAAPVQAQTLDCVFLQKFFKKYSLKFTIGMPDNGRFDEKGTIADEAIRKNFKVKVYVNKTEADEKFHLNLQKSTEPYAEVKVFEQASADQSAKYKSKLVLTKLGSWSSYLKKLQELDGECAIINQ